MDIISFNEAATANSRIESFINDPDSTSGVVTVPTTIAAGETITIPAGRMAILPDLQIDGDLVVDGEVFIPNGTSLSKVVEKVTSTDNAIVRFDGTTGAVQNSGVIIDDNNNVGIGTSSPSTRLHISSNASTLPAGSPQLIISGDSNKERISIRSSAGGAALNVGNCGGTIASPTPTTSGMFLGSYQFGGYSPVGWTRGAQIAGEAAANWTDTSVPTNIIFQTVSAGSTALVERMRIDTSGHLIMSTAGTPTIAYTFGGQEEKTGISCPADAVLNIKAIQGTYFTSGPFGYGTGTGGTVTQLTSKSTAVTLNKPTGQITMNNAALAAGANVLFAFYNSTVTANDQLIVNMLSVVSGYNNYKVENAGVIGGGGNYIRLTNISGISLSETPSIIFTVIKGAIA